jgi:hypothetical protein
VKGNASFDCGFLGDRSIDRRVDSDLMHPVPLRANVEVGQCSAVQVDGSGDQLPADTRNDLSFPRMKQTRKRDAARRRDAAKLTSRFDQGSAGCSPADDEDVGCFIYLLDGSPQ